LLTSRPGRFTSGERIFILFEREGLWAPEAVWKIWRKRNLWFFPGIETKVFQSVAQSLYQLSYLKSYKKGKAVPLQARRGPEGSRKLRFPDFVTTAQDGGKVVSLTHRPSLSPGNTPGTHFC